MSLNPLKAVFRTLLGLASRGRKRAKGGPASGGRCRAVGLIGLGPVERCWAGAGSGEEAQSGWGGAGRGEGVGGGGRWGKEGEGASCGMGKVMSGG